jgi:hypothetical protein
MDPAVILYSLFGPFLVWPLEYFLPYPYIIEELFKSVLVLFFAKKSAKSFIFAGIAFALTETVFYSFNINAYGSVGLLFTRFILTACLHSLTFLIIFWFAKKSKGLIVFGFIVSALIHYLYNRYIPAY